MRIMSQEELKARLSYDRLLSELPRLLTRDVSVPQRHAHILPQGEDPDGHLLVMPAWSSALGGVKLVNVHPANAQRGLPSVMASYLVFDGQTGAHLALLDGGELTARRTAAVAALAMSRLASQGSKTLLILGSGRIASELALAYSEARDLRRILVHSPTLKNAEALVERLKRSGFPAETCLDLRQACQEADLLAAATLSQAPLLLGQDLHSGQNLALIGGYTPTMREADDAAIINSHLYVDTMTALTEAGDLSQPLAAGLITAENIQGDLKALCQPDFSPKASGYSLFKSVGEASQDLCAAQIALA